MKAKILLVGLLLFYCLSNAQSYLGYTTQSVRLRSEPEINPDNIIETIPAQTEIFISGEDEYSTFYKVIDVRTNRYGYVSEKYVHLIKRIEEDTNQVFTNTGTIQSEHPQAEINNSTDGTLRLQLGDDVYYFSPYETRTITLTMSGTIHYTASEAGVLPAIGREYFEENHGYTWKFWIENQYH